MTGTRDSMRGGGQEEEKGGRVGRVVADGWLVFLRLRSGGCWCRVDLAEEFQYGRSPESLCVCSPECPPTSQSEKVQDSNYTQTLAFLRLYNAQFNRFLFNDELLNFGLRSGLSLSPSHKICNLLIREWGRDSRRRSGKFCRDQNEEAVMSLVTTSNNYSLEWIRESMCLLFEVFPNTAQYHTILCVAHIGQQEVINKINVGWPEGYGRSNILK